MTVGTPIILDCDPGHDDAVAILLALGSPAIEVLGVTTCFGNCSLHDATRNALRTLGLAGRLDIPVAGGAAGPMQGETHLGNYVHGASGLDGPVLADPDTTALQQDAVSFMVDTLRQATRPVTLVVTGPMTNVAHLLTNHPDIVGDIAEVIFMGGSTERGNHTPTAEFNTYCDPEALAVVLTSGLQVRMVGLNLTHQALATQDVVESMRAMDHDIGRVVAEWMGFFGDSYNRVWEFDAPPVHDPCTVAALADPDLITWRDAFVAVELDGTWTRGTTVVDLHRRHPDRAANCAVAMHLDTDGYWALVLDSLQRLAA